MKSEHSSKPEKEQKAPNDSQREFDESDTMSQKTAESSDEAQLAVGEEDSEHVEPESLIEDKPASSVSSKILKDTTINLTDDEDEDEDESAVPVIEDVEIQSFEDLDLEEDLLKVIRNVGWSNPTPVQGKCLPHTIVGKDVAGFAQTGTGKTGVFLITLANTIKRAKDNGQKGGPKALILVPTRELAVQIDADAKPIFDALNITSLAVYGGVDYEKQAKHIKEGVDVIVATPGRLKDYYQKRLFTLNYCNQFVCDEADRMFDMGFVEDVEYFLAKLTEKTQKLLFSATTNDQVKELAFEYLENPEYISVNPEVITPESIDQYAILCESTQKLQVMLGLLRDHQPKCSIIFTNTKLVAEWLHYKLEKNGIVVDLITGDLPQRKRINLINRIKAGEIKALIATDVASRGLHITDITHVYNFDLPNEASNYVHRIGRTARAGARGASYSLVCEDYGHNLEAIKKYIGDQVEITTEWFKDEYLEIADQAGNPYQDPEFKGNTMKSDSGSSGRGDFRKSSSRRRDQGQSRRAGDGEQKGQRGRGGRPSGQGKKQKGRDEQAAAGQRSRQRKGGQGKAGGTRQDQQPRQAASQSRKRRSQKSRHFDEHKRTARSEQTRQQPAAAPATETPSSIGGIFKKIVSVMFGRKKK